jgi:CheY-like chemotaxis protein
VQCPRALIVDDNPVNQELLRFLLESDDFDVLLASSGEEGLRCFDLFAPDVLILDVQLPGICGLSLTADVRSRSHQTQPCIIAVTSYAMPGDRERAIAAGCDRYMPKPIDTQTFTADVRRVMIARACRAVA